MDIFIYFPANMKISRDEIEDALDEALTPMGSVTGGGSGASGSNIDIRIDDARKVSAATEAILMTLRKLKVPANSYLRVGETKIPV